MKNERMRFTGPVLIAVVIGVIIWANAGDLTPPAGPPSPTMKTLTQVEPRTPVQTLSGDSTSSYVIDQPGSYYLTGNITGESGKDGIRLDASNVTLDLNGFTLIGVPGSLDGVYGTAELNNVTIRNGKISDWGDDGVDGDGGLHNSLIENLSVMSNLGQGIAGAHCSVVNCKAYNNGTSGISVFNGTVTGCTADGNYVGIETNLASVVTHCRATVNVEDGFLINSSGEKVSLVTHCLARGNGATGISVIYGSVVKCVSTQNTNNGIALSSNCVIRDNVCHGSQFGNGIYVRADGVRNRIENNNLAGNVIGIDVDGVNNIIIGNTARGNTTANYDISAGNSYGPIVDVAGMGDMSLVAGAEHPWANFEY